MNINIEYCASLGSNVQPGGGMRGYSTILDSDRRRGDTRRVAESRFFEMSGITI